MTFKARLRLEMQKKGLNAKGLAASAGISVNTLNMYIGYREAIPSAETAVKLAKALSVTVEYLMEGTPVRPAARKDSADLVAKDSSGDDDGVSLSIEYLIRMEIAKTPRLRLPLLLRLIRAFNQAENPESLFFPPDDRKEPEGESGKESSDPEKPSPGPGR